MMKSLCKRKCLGSMLICMALILLIGMPVMAEDVIKIGGLACLEGPFAIQGVDCMRGIEQALAEFNYEVAGKKIEFTKYSSDGSPDKAVASARKAIEQDNVDILIGPLSGSEGLAIKDYAKTQPNKTFINGSSAAQNTTLRDPAPNFYRWGLDGAQWMAGLGNYVYDVKGYRKMVTLAEDYSFQYTQVFGFMLEFCAKGGKVPKKFWVPIGTKDFSSVIAAIPEDVDAIWVGLGGSDSVVFLTQYTQAGGEKAIVGSSVTVDQTVLNVKGRFRKFVIGVPAAGPVADDYEGDAWRAYAAKYKELFPDGFASPSLFAHGYYISTKAALLALQQTNGDLSEGQAKLRAALSKLEFEQPTGHVKLDQNRQAISTNIVTEVTELPDGTLVNKVIEVVPDVSQTLGMDRDAFLALGSPSRDNPSCP